MSTFSDESLATISGTTTAWLPIPSPWLSIAACSTQIYAQRAGLGGNLIAFDPLFGESIVPSAIPCLPTEVTSSWYQSNTAITTVLGPTFVCPGAYSAVQTILVNPTMEQILCCPSKYSLNIAITGHGTFPSQCTSSLSSGQTLTYESTTPGGPWGIVTSTVPPTSTASAGPTIVYGMHVNGFNILQAAITGSVPSGVTTPGPETVEPTISPARQTSLPTSPSGTDIPSSDSLSGSAVAGIAIGVALLVLAVAGAAWFFFRRCRRPRDSRRPMERESYKPEIMESNFARSPRGLHEIGLTRGKGEPVEIDGRRKMKSKVYELG